MPVSDISDDHIHLQSVIETFSRDFPRHVRSHITVRYHTNTCWSESVYMHLSSAGCRGRRLLGFLSLGHLNL